MNYILPLHLLVFLYAGGQGESEECPRVCTCETAVLSSLPINSLLVNTQHHNHSEEHVPTYQNKNEVLDEGDERKAQHGLGEEKLRAVTCVLQSPDNLDLFHLLSPDTQVLTILQGPGTGNITLDETYFQHLVSLVVLEIHGFPHNNNHLRLRNCALKHLKLLQYVNLQYVHLLGDKNFGNRPAPVSKMQFLENIMHGAVPTKENDEENNIIPEVIQFDPQQDMKIVPYSVYREQQERAGLSTFANLHSLVFLRVFHCSIKEVNWEMFEGLQQLQYLSLEGNKIPFIHEFSFYGTPNLKHLVLSHNKLLDLQSLGLAGLLKLETLDLSYNNISHLSEFSLPPFPSLVTADFHHNPLEVILPYTFQVLNSTKQLFLGGKIVRLDIHPNSFSGLKKLHKLSINGVKLEVLEREYLKGMPHLRGIRIEGSIHELSFDAFADVPKLQELIMKNCSMRKISMDAFYGLYELIYLDLSHNELEILPPSLFDHQQSLKEINLRYNRLTTLPAGIFTKTKAKLIRLDKNPWHCTCEMNEWQPSQINKVKERITDDSLCQSRYDKGSMCTIRYIYRYVYDQSVTPKCATPDRYNGWSVFHLLRRHLRCNKKIYKEKIFNKNHSEETKEYSGQSENYFQQNTSSENNQTEKNISPFIIRSSLSVGTVNLVEELRTESSTRVHIDSQNQTTDHSQKSEPQPANLLPDNQRMWTERNKEKYKLLMKKEKMLQDKIKASYKKETQTQENYKISLDPISKSKKMTSMKKKWEMKMKNTMENLNEVPKDSPKIS